MRTWSRVWGSVWGSALAIGLGALAIVDLAALDDRAIVAIAQDDDRDATTDPLETLPLAPHPPPVSLIDWREQATANEIGAGDYIEALHEFSFGVLTWSRWPVRVSIDPTAAPEWRAEVRAALADWQTYVPIELVSESEAIAPDDLPEFESSDARAPEDLTVDIAIVRAVVPSRRTESGDFRAASARASYSFFVERDLEANRERFGHRFTIRVSPRQHGQFLRSAVRHEFGHALGIWGHSDDPGDVMYAAQVAQPVSVSPRDLNTLLQIHARPTRLGWWLDRDATDATADDRATTDD